MSNFNFRGLSFRPHLLQDIRRYNGQKFFSDVSAGVTVGIVALPLAMAFAIASGVKPEAGIITAIIAGLLISVFGGSRVQIGGPAGAFIVVVYGIIERYGLANLLISTIMAGVLLFAMGFFKLGNLIRYIPIAVVIGFTNGIAVLIALSQVKSFLGIQIEHMPADFFGQLARLWEFRATLDSLTVALGLISLVILFLWPRVTPKATGVASKWRGRISRVPGPIIVLALGTALVSAFHLPIETIGSKFGGLPSTLPGFALPVFSWETVKLLFAPTITIALLCAIESLLCARVADSITGERHDPNQELMGQGIANVVTPFFGGIPATGTIARTVTNIRSGAASPIAGVIHSLTLIGIVLIAAPLASDIPLAVLAAILLHVAFNMGEWHEFPKLRQFKVSYQVIMVATFLLTIIFDLTVAVEVGIVLSCLFFIYRVSTLTHVVRLGHAELERNHPEPLSPEIHVYRIYGSLFFGAVSKLERLIDPLSEPPRVMVLEMHQLIQLDTTGLDALEAIHRKLVKHGGYMVLCGLNEQPASLVQRSGFAGRLGPANLCADLPTALAHASALTHASDAVKVQVLAR